MSINKFKNPWEATESQLANPWDITGEPTYDGWGVNNAGQIVYDNGKRNGNVFLFKDWTPKMVEKEPTYIIVRGERVRDTSKKASIKEVVYTYKESGLGEPTILSQNYEWKAGEDTLYDFICSLYRFHLNEPDMKSKIKAVHLVDFKKQNKTAEDEEDDEIYSPNFRMATTGPTRKTNSKKGIDVEYPKQGELVLSINKNCLAKIESVGRLVRGYLDDSNILLNTLQHEKYHINRAYDLANIIVPFPSKKAYEIDYWQEEVNAANGEELNKAVAGEFAVDRQNRIKFYKSRLTAWQNLK